MIDPEQIHTAQQLREQLRELFDECGQSIHRLAEDSGLSTATVKAILDGTTNIPQAPKLKAFVTACGQDPRPWVEARGRAVQAAKVPRLRVVNVPRVESTFVGRTEELARLTQALAPPARGRAAAGVVVQAVHGLGGIGKSTLAAYWARTHLDDFAVVWWITADTAAAVQAGLAGLAVAGQPEVAGQPLEVLAARAVGWLAANRDWLLVLDNVTAPGDVAPLLDRDLPGPVVVTSRLADGWHRLGAALIRLDILTEQQAIDSLTRIATNNRNDQDDRGGRGGAELAGAAELVSELGFLPLAVEQAAAYLRQACLTPARYLQLLRADPAVMYDQAARGADGERTIARIWRVTLDHLAAEPLAADLLRVLAWWAPDNIPRSLLTPLAGPARLTTALGDLAAYNMITLDPGSITVHRLVQAVARTPDPRTPHQPDNPDAPGDPHRQPADIHAARTLATDLLHQARPATTDDPAQWATWHTLLPHIDALAEHAGPDTATTSHLLDRTASFLKDQGAVARAISYFQRALTCDQRLHGPDHPSTLTSRNNLAYAYESAGDLGRAIPLYENTLAERERVLGGDHPSTLSSRNNLAYAYRVAGDLARAIPLYEATLTDCQRVLGEEHPITKAVRANLDGVRR